MDEAEKSILTLEGKIEERAKRKAAEDARLEEFFEETKDITKRLRLDLEDRARRQEGGSSPLSH